MIKNIFIHTHICRKKRKERGKANVVTCQYLGKGVQGFFGLVHNFYVPQMMSKLNTQIIKELLFKCLKSNHTIKITQRSTSKAYI